MNQTARILKLMSDETRLRILMLLGRQELCVCQMMGVLGVSQPLVSRNLALLSAAGILKERKDGKLIFYSLNRSMPKTAAKLLKVLKAQLVDDPTLAEDVLSLGECHEYQKKTGKCDMKTFLQYMEQKRKRKRPRPAAAARA